MISYSGWTMLGAAASIGQTQGSALIINSFFGVVLNASFGIASQLNRFISMFAQNLSQAAIPQIVKSHSGGDDIRALNLVTYISKYSFFLMMLPALPILLETEYLLKLWLGKIPEYTVIFTQLMIILGLSDSLRAGIPAAIQATGKIKWFQIFMSLSLLMGLPISIYLFKTGLPPYYIQLVYIGASILNTVVAVAMLKQLINFNVFFLLKNAYSKILIVTLFVLPLYSIHFFLKESVIRFIFTVILSIVLYIGAVYLFGFNRSEKVIVINSFRLVREKLFN